MADAKSLIETITSTDPELRDRSLQSLITGDSTVQILSHCEELERFRRRSTNLYERVRASLFLHTLYRYILQEASDLPSTGWIPVEGVDDLMQRRFEQAISSFRSAMHRDGPNGTIASALARAYEEIALQTLADQVRRSVRSCQGNRWMFRVGSAHEHPLRLHSRLLDREGDEQLFPILVERTPVRLDLSHSGWSDIFFLGMDFPEGARVLNISVDLGVFGRDAQPRPPIETYCRVISEPILRISSLDLNDTKDVGSLEELFNFGNDYLGLVKAGIIASGLVPPSLEGSSTTLKHVLDRVIRPGYGLEVVSKVNDIPKGSRLAVSTNLLASLISLLMRATCQTRGLTGPLLPEEAPVVVARAILGEWLGGSGGGWQDSGGIFPGIKLIEGVPASEDDPEFGISRGRLLPKHTLLDQAGEGSTFHNALANSLVLVHGGMAQNVGPILNMVTEKYLLRAQEEWEARREALRIFEGIVAAVQSADVRTLGQLTTQNWDGPLKRMIPWVTNRFTESIIAEVKAHLGDDFWGFLMLGGMSGGGMAFFVAPHRRDAFRSEALAILKRVKERLHDALPFAMEPVVYDFAINPLGTVADVMQGNSALMPPRYYSLQIPRMITQGHTEVNPQRRVDIDQFASRSADTSELLRLFRATVNTLFPVSRSALDPTSEDWNAEADRIRRENGFDPVQHEQLREDLQRGRIGLARNRLPVDTEIRDVHDDDLIDARVLNDDRTQSSVESRLGEIAVVSLAAGVGSRWTTGAGVVKAVNPFVMLDGLHRSFLEIHLAKSRQAMERYGVTIPHVVTTSYLTHSAIEHHLELTRNYGHHGPVFLSRGQSIGQRLIPMTRDLTFLWEEQAHETLDENKQKVREAGRRAILGWAQSQGEGADYVDNVPLQRFNPPGHFYEVPNLLRNGILARLLKQFPGLQWLLVHNIDTLGADLDPRIFAKVRESGATLAFEVIARRLDDRGGGLARVNGRLRLLEGLAQPREEVEFLLRYYNSMTTWVHIDGLLSAFELTREDLSGNPDRVASAIRSMAARVPTYVTIKDVKRRWGHAQEDVFPVVQFEKLWGDLTALPDLDCTFLAVDRPRGQQLKDPAQLDGWANDGSLDYVRGLCSFDR
ncbi:UTP--glucose-1-phosphate uridylyltransferase [Tautonia rosea]|uniref:UTP--glucose-1-phosphate uridylyltransferase n=1 Tax=Tautonia rosea TaxID=2728037 RepID=UPI001475069B|nr:UTP--glucose-1-phosphate uridylyltransferase [Tautonia rosea]